MPEIRVYLDEYDYYPYTDFVDAGGGHLAYEPWGAHECELLKRLAAQYGNRLRGVIKKPLGDMELYVETGGWNCINSARLRIDSSAFGGCVRRGVVAERSFAAKAPSLSTGSARRPPRPDQSDRV